MGKGEKREVGLKPSLLAIGISCGCASSAFRRQTASGRKGCWSAGVLRFCQTIVLLSAHLEGCRGSSAQAVWFETLGGIFGFVACDIKLASAIECANS
jgi:hypothetical protein